MPYWLDNHKEIGDFEKDWALGDYTENGCDNCSRHRVCKTPNGKHRCEECNWCPEEKRYVMAPW